MSGSIVNLVMQQSIDNHLLDVLLLHTPDDIPSKETAVGVSVLPYFVCKHRSPVRLRSCTLYPVQHGDCFHPVHTDLQDVIALNDRHAVALDKHSLVPLHMHVVVTGLRWSH